MKNSNINSGLRKNSNDIIEKDILSEEEKNENILKNKDSIQIFTKPIILENEKSIFKNDKISYENIKEKNNNNEINFNLELNLGNNIHDIEFFDEYFQTEFESMDYDEVLEKDKRNFWEYLKEKLLDNQYIINTFFNDEPFKPKSIKILLLTL